MIYKWHLFKHGRESIEVDDLRSGRAVEGTTSNIVEKVEKLITEDTRLKKKQLSELIGISKTTILRILHDHLGMTKVSARWVPRMLTPLQKQQRVEVSKHFLELCDENPTHVLERIGTSPPKKFKVSELAGKLMTTIFKLISRFQKCIKLKRDYIEKEK
ncbi:Protein GVQW3, partial [Anthophora quadrimaculata]